LHGLQSATILNDAIGRVLDTAAEDGRYQVQVLEPPAAVAAKPDPIRVKPENIEVLPAAAGQPGGLPTLQSRLQPEQVRTVMLPGGPAKRSRYRPRVSAAGMREQVVLQVSQCLRCILK
jgi:hypothetical protein